MKAILSILPTVSFLMLGLSLRYSAEITNISSIDVPIDPKYLSVPGFNFTKRPMFDTSGNWTDLKCDFTEIGRISGREKWELSYGSHAWDQLIGAWNLPQRADNFPNQSFPEFVWKVFGQGDGADCGEADKVPCLTRPKCINDEISKLPPAGWAILYSIVSLHEIFKEQNDALDEAHARMQGQALVVASTFAPQREQSNAASVILNILQGALGLVTAGGLSSAFSSIRELADLNPEVFESVKNVVDFGITCANAALSNLPSPSTDFETGGLLEVTLGEYYSKMKDAQAAALAQIMNGEQGKGAVNALWKDDYRGVGDFIKGYSSVHFVSKPEPKLVVTPDLSVQNSRVDKSQHICNTNFSEGDELRDLMSEETASTTLWCDTEGNSWFLLNAISRECNLATYCSSKNVFEALDGGTNEVLGGKEFGGITIADIISSSWAGFKENGMKNGYTINDRPIRSVAGGFNSSVVENVLPLQGGIRAPGFFNFTICLDYNEAVRKLHSGLDSSQPVCGIAPKVGKTMPDIQDPGTYEPDYCRLHVIQYQKRNGNTNLLGAYQLQVDIFDNASLKIGTAVKQDAGKPLIIIDSVLPYRLIVAAEGKDDESPLEFWYADQWWTSTDQEHHCHFGAYDSGKREGNCGFSCPMPEGGRPSSTTRSVPLPTDAVNAVGDPTFVNTFITRVFPPASTIGRSEAEPTPTYVRGRCGVHVVHYQKDRTLKPASEYQLEVTVFDGAVPQNAIGHSGKVPARDGRSITVNGLMQPLLVAVFSTDDQPVWFDYDGHQWDSNNKDQCKVGDYHEGERHMDCSFAC